MNQKRKLPHIAFWGLYYIITLYNELYLSESFSKEPSFEMFFQSVLVQMIIVGIKMATAYFIMYYIIPQWLLSREKTKVLIQGIIVLIVATIIMRLATHFLIWKLIYHATVTSFTFLRLLARFFYSFLDLLQITAIVLAIKLFRLRINAIQNEKAIVQEKLKAEMLHLKSQTNPHFLFNTLNSVFALCRANSSNAATAVMQLSKILRYMLYRSAQQTIAISEELQVIEDYVALQKLRFGGRITFVLTQQIDKEAQIAPLLLLPLVENAFKHNHESNTLINCQLEVKDQQIIFQIENPISTFSPPPKEQAGIGLSNIKRQLELLYQTFSFEYFAEKEVFKVILTIDLRTYATNELFDYRR